jgi:hypothetical protein
MAFPLNYLSLLDRVMSLLLSPTGINFFFGNAILGLGAADDEPVMQYLAKGCVFLRLSSPIVASSHILLSLPGFQDFNPGLCNGIT